MKCAYCGSKGQPCSGCTQVVCGLCSILEAPLDPYIQVEGKEVEICHVRKDGTYGVFK